MSLLFSHKLLFILIESLHVQPECYCALIDVMRGSSIPIKTTGLGMIASAGLLIFISGTKGKRLLTPNTSILSHQFTWGSFGKEHELFAAVKEFDLTTKRMIKHYKKCTGLSDKDIRKYLLPPQDVWLSAPEALKLGICDNVKEMRWTNVCCKGCWIKRQLNRHYVALNSHLNPPIQTPPSRHQ